MTDLPALWVALGVVALILLVNWLRSRPKIRRRFSSVGVDVEGDLVNACGGDQAMAERLIRHEMERKPGLSRTGAAVMALSRLRDDRS